MTGAEFKRVSDDYEARVEVEQGVTKRPGRMGTRRLTRARIARHLGVYIAVVDRWLGSSSRTVPHQNLRFASVKAVKELAYGK